MTITKLISPLVSHHLRTSTEDPSMTPLNLDSLPFPLGKTDEDARRDPVLCTTCFNIHPTSARTAVLGPQIRMHERSNWDGAIRAAQLIDGVKETDRVVLEATIPKLVSWNVEINVVDMAKSSSGCATCFLLKEALAKVYNGVVNLDDSSLFLDVVFCEKIALRIGVKREPEDEEGEILLPWEHRTLEPVAGLETFELYTLPGESSVPAAKAYFMRCTDIREAPLLRGPLWDVL